MTFIALILGILASLIVTTSSGVQTKAKDTERKTDINAMDSHFEAYYAEYGYYPTLANLNDTNWRHQYLKGLDDEAFKDPDGTSATLAASPAKHVYSYKSVGDSGKPCNNTTVDCTSFTVTATLDQGTSYNKSSY